MGYTHLSIVVLSAFIFGELPLAAQYPGQYPPGGYPPGGYPPGGYPPQTGGPGIPFPRRGKKKTETTTKDENQANLKQITGVLRSLDEKSVLITADDTRNVSLKRTSTTKFLKKGEDLKPDILKPGDHVMVEATEDNEGYFTAVRVNLEKEGTAQEREKASAPVQMPAATTHRSDDDDRPIMRRNEPKPAAPSETAKDTAPHPAPPVETPKTATPASAEPPDIPEQPERADVPVVESDVPIDESDPGRPRLKRGRPAGARKPAAQPAKEIAAASPPKATEIRETAPTPPTAPTRAPAVEQAPKADPRIEKAREAVANFTQSLPAYVCQEQIARFVNTSAKVNWQPVDVVSADMSS